MSRQVQIEIVERRPNPPSSDFTDEQMYLSHNIGNKKIHFYITRSSRHYETIDSEQHGVINKDKKSKYHHLKTRHNNVEKIACGIC